MDTFTYLALHGNVFFFFFTGTSVFNFPFQFLPGIWRNDVGHFIDYLKDDVQILCDIPERFTDQSELFTSIRFDSFLCFWFRAINKYNTPRSIKQIFFLYRIYKLFTQSFTLDKLWLVKICHQELTILHAWNELRTK